LSGTRFPLQYKIWKKDSELTRKLQSCTTWFRWIRAGICCFLNFGGLKLLYEFQRMYLSDKNLAVCLQIFKMQGSITRNLMLFLGNYRLKIVMVFLDVVLFWYWPLWPVFAIFAWFQWFLCSLFSVLQIWFRHIHAFFYHCVNSHITYYSVIYSSIYPFLYFHKVI
jgi:hypothetical protein